jgi:spore coat protein SA
MSSKLKVAIVTPGSFPIPSPRSSSVETVVDKLTNSLQNEVEFSIYGKQSIDMPSSEKRGNLTYIRLKYRGWKKYLQKIILSLSKLTPDIIQVENRPKYVPILQEKFPTIPVLLSLHSTMFISNSRISKEELMNCISLSKKVIVNSHFLKRFIMNKINCDESKIFVNHLGVDTNQFQAKWLSCRSDKTKLLKKQLDLEDKKILLFVGRLRKMKGVDKIIKALPAIIKYEPNTILIIAGSAFYGTDKVTRYVHSLYKLAEEYSEHVRFSPFIAHENIHKWFQMADIVLVPSIGNEAFGLVNVEAMACGVPVIATNIGGMPEIIEHGHTGYLIIEKELAEFVITMFSDVKICQEMGVNSFTRVQEQFTWEKSSERLHNLYQTTRI